MAKLNMKELEDHVDEWLFVVVLDGGRHFPYVKGGRLRNRDGVFYIDRSEGAIRIKDSTPVYSSADEAADAAGIRSNQK